MTGTGEELTGPSLVESAVSRPRREILSGGSDPGERLVEEQLTRRSGISRAPLPEALRLLAGRPDRTAYGSRPAFLRAG